MLLLLFLLLLLLLLLGVRREKKANEAKHIELYGGCIKHKYSYYEEKI